MVFENLGDRLDPFIGIQIKENGTWKEIGQIPGNITLNKLELVAQADQATKPLDIRNITKYTAEESVTTLTNAYKLFRSNLVDAHNNLLKEKGSVEERTCPV